MNEIRNEIANGQPFLINDGGSHGVVCYGIDGDKLMIMDPDFGRTDKYPYDNYASRCSGNLIITCINEIELHGELNNPEKSYIYEASQSLKILPGTKIENVKFSANVTGTSECANHCIAPTCQIILDGKFIMLHVRNGETYSYELINSAGSLISTGSGTLDSNDAEVVLCYVSTSIYYMRTITITSSCGTSRTLLNYEIPYYSD